MSIIHNIGVVIMFYRSNDILPWDDDVDLAMDIEDLEKVQKVILKKV